VHVVKYQVRIRVRFRWIGEKLQKFPDLSEHHQFGLTHQKNAYIWRSGKASSKLVNSSVANLRKTWRKYWEINSNGCSSRGGYHAIKFYPNDNFWRRNQRANITQALKIRYTIHRNASLWEKQFSPVCDPTTRTRNDRWLHYDWLKQRVKQAKG
jgi:hypothetical protein